MVVGEEARLGKVAGREVGGIARLGVRVGQGVQGLRRLLGLDIPGVSAL